MHTITLRDAWGKEREVDGTVEQLATSYLFTHQRWDERLGLYDYNARYHDAEIGRFISADTIIPDKADPQAWNRFTYVLNQPLTFVDPSGHNGCSVGYLDDCGSSDFSEKREWLEQARSEWDSVMGDHNGILDTVSDALGIAFNPVEWLRKILEMGANVATLS